MRVLVVESRSFFKISEIFIMLNERVVQLLLYISIISIYIIYK